MHRVSGPSTKFPHPESGSTYATLNAPLEKAPSIPQLVLIVTPPLVMLKLARATLFRL